jgi:hypothetical protein
VLLHAIILSIATLSCKKFVTVDAPVTQLVSANVFTDDVTATAALTGIYSNMMNTSVGFCSGAITLYGGLSADEFQNYSTSGDQVEFAVNALKAENNIIKQIWANAYQYIYAANTIMENLAHPSGVSLKTRQELIGEAKFIRAFCNFYLVNLWGKVPLVVSSSYNMNDTLSRLDINQVYEQIVKDLTDAQQMLPADFETAAGERIRPNRWAATALLAKVFLYSGDWEDAIEQSSAVIEQTSLFQLDSDLSQVFLANSIEAIWQMEPVTPDKNTWEGYLFILTNGPIASVGQVALNPQLIDSFEPGDLRKTNWIGTDITNGQTTYYPLKYKIKSGTPIIEYYTVLRLSEQYLIRAEAEARKGDIESAVKDLNIIRQRADLPGISTTIDDQTCLADIEKERKIELFAEWGNRWLDLKRTGRSEAVLSLVKSNWQASDTLYPIPQIDIQNDPHLAQNPGY